MTRKILTAYLNPPIPVRDQDWIAYFDGDIDGEIYAYGETEQEAINNLLEIESQS